MTQAEKREDPNVIAKVVPGALWYAFNADGEVLSVGSGQDKPPHVGETLDST